MKKVVIGALAAVILALTASNVLLIVKHERLCATVREFGEQVSEHQAYIDEQVALILDNLDSIKNRADAQYSQTVGMKKTYDNLLDEQKKKTVDTTSKDSAVAEVRKLAEKYYSEKKYAAAYKEFKKVLSYQNDDIKSRDKKMKSLYYMNRSDSSKYSEILEDIRILKTNGHFDEESAKIEASIMAENGGLN